MACRLALQTANIAFVKTHKTGSTTLASILYRYAARHGVKVRFLVGALLANSMKEAFDAFVFGWNCLDLVHPPYQSFRALRRQFYNNY